MIIKSLISVARKLEKKIGEEEENRKMDSSSFFSSPDPHHHHHDHRTQIILFHVIDKKIKRNFISFQSEIRKENSEITIRLN
jgi:hypothetical protein